MTADLKRGAGLRGAIISTSWALLFVTAALVLTLLLQRLALRVYFILFVPAVMFSTWFGGGIAGIVASALTVAATVLLLPGSEIVDQLAWLVVAAIVTLGTSVLTAGRRRAEEKLIALAIGERERRLNAESLSELKTELLAQVAHELRQPMSAISVAAGLLETPSESARERAVSVIVRQSAQLRELIDDLLDLSRLSRRELQLRKAEIDICELVDDSVQVIAGDVAARRLGLSSSLPDCPVHLVADPTRVRQILTNLLSNAVKFTPEGGKIDLAVERTPSQIVMRIRDTGNGITADRLPYIFDMFHKGDGPAAGLGIGLAVVKGLTELHGGSVEARSSGVGQGSEFIVRLPLVTGHSA